MPFPQPPQPTDTMERLAVVTANIKALERERETLRQFVLHELHQQGLENQTVNGYYISVAHRKSWTYSERVVALKTQIKESEKVEQQDGTATAKVTKYIVVKPTKGEV